MAKPEDFQGGEQDTDLAMPNPERYWRVHDNLRTGMDALGIKTDGLEQLQALDPQSGTIIGSTHDSWFDIAAITALDLPRELHFVGKDSLKRTPVVGKYLTSLGGDVGVLWLDRDSEESKAAVIDNSVRLLNANEWLGVYLPGTRSKSSDRRSLPELRTGFARMALLAEGTTDILPVAAGYREGWLRKKASPFGMGIVAGKVVRVEHYEGDARDAGFERQMRDITAHMYKTLFKLKLHAVDLAESR